MKWVRRMLSVYVVTLAVIAVLAVGSAATSRPPVGGGVHQPSHTENPVSHDAYEIHKMLAHTS